MLTQSVSTGALRGCVQSSQPPRALGGAGSVVEGVQGGVREYVGTWHLLPSLAVNFKLLKK